LEDHDLEATARHQALIDGSAKLGFLKAMLPKLRAKGHRVLLFSQVRIKPFSIDKF
jgi:chromodomain-helicase-DNA-binding protein 4